MPFTAMVQIKNIASIFPNPDQPRKSFNQVDLEDLAASIKQNGLLQPIAVTKQGMIIAGERRWRACKLAGLDKIDCIVKDMDPVKVAVMAIVENLQRKDLSLTEKAKAYQKMLDDGHANDEDGKPSIQVLAKILGVKPFWISARLRYLKVLPDAQAAYEAGEIGNKALYYISQFSQPKQELMLQHIQAGKCSNDVRLRATYQTIAAMDLNAQKEQMSLLPNDNDNEMQAEVNRLQQSIKGIAAKLAMLVTDNAVEKVDGHIPGHQAEMMADVLENLAKTAKGLRKDILLQDVRRQLETTLVA